MRTFFITAAQQKKIDDWDKCLYKYHGAIGGHLKYSFIPTSIGTIVRVDCSSCNEHIELYDQM